MSTAEVQLYFLSLFAIIREALWDSLSGGKFVLRYSIKASRSPGSTSAPHLIILSTSLVHAALPNLCCTIMVASWHSKHAVFTFGCSGPDGRTADCPYRSGMNMSDRNVAKERLCLDIDLHPVNDVD